MEGNYPPSFYSAEKGQENRHQPSQPPQQQEQQHQQHAAHYPLELPIPYHTTPQQQSEFVVDQQHRTFHVPTAQMLSALYHDSGAVLSNSNILHHALQHTPVTYGGHGVKSSLHHAPPTTTFETGGERNIQPIRIPELVEVRNIQPTTTQGPDVQSSSSKRKGQTPVVQAPSKQIQSEEQREQVSPSQPCNAPTTSSEKPQLLAALNLKTKTSVRDLPPSLSVRLTSQNKVDGVCAKEVIEKGAEFGPVTGTLLNEDLGWSKETTWEVCMSDSVFYIDGRKNWMSHLRCAQSEEEQNMEVYQYYGKIYFRSIKVIEPESELKVFYSEEYGKHVGIKTRLKDLKFNQDSQKFQCSLCEGLFSSSKLILRHIRCEHCCVKPDEIIPVLTWRKKEKSKFVVSSNKQTEKKVHLADSNYKCSTCQKVFPSHGRLKEHELFHIIMDECKPYKCNECNQSYKAQITLNRHEREAHGIFHEDTPGRRGRKCSKTQIDLLKNKVKNNFKPYECSKCNQTYTSLPWLKRHEKEAHEEPSDDEIPRKKVSAGSKTSQSLSNKAKHGFKPYECSECSHMCKSLALLKKHIQVTHGYQCQFCPKRFDKKGDRTKHERTHQAYHFSQANVDVLESGAALDEPKDMLGKTSDYYQRLFKCQFCSKRYSSQSGINQHEREVHMKAETFKCTQCPKSFPSKYRLKRHLVGHKVLHIHRCTLCPRTFASESALNNHQGEHTGLKPVPCEICGRGFRTRKLVSHHKRRMHQDRPKCFICSICNKGFADKNHLKVHERRHKGIRQFVCLECGKAFTAKHALVSHTQTVHTNEKPFSCQICSKSFSLNHYLTLHIARHHMAKQVLQEDGSRSILQ